MSAKNKKRLSLPKVRHVGDIHPETRVKPSGKIYQRSATKKKKPTWVERVDWFGESEI